MEYHAKLFLNISSTKFLMFSCQIGDRLDLIPLSFITRVKTATETVESLLKKLNFCHM